MTRKFCGYAHCQEPVVAKRETALYCSMLCSNREKRRLWLLRREGKIAPAPAHLSRTHRVARKAAPLETGGKCAGCAHVRPQPASWRGVECAAELYMACMPLLPGTPKCFKEAL